MLKHVALAVSLLALPFMVHAEDTAAKAVSAYDQGLVEQRPLWEMSFADTYQGFVTLNAYLITERNGRPTFCPPGDLMMKGDQLIEILRAGMKHHPALADTEWQVSLHEALVDRFPCRAVKGDRPWY